MVPLVKVRKTLEQQRREGVGHLQDDLQKFFLQVFTLLRNPLPQVPGLYDSL